MRYTYPQNIILDINKPTSYFTHDYWTIPYSHSFVQNNYFSSSLRLTTSFNFPTKFKTPIVSRNTLTLFTPSPFFIKNSLKTSGISKTQFKIRSQKLEFLKKHETKNYQQFLTNFRHTSNYSPSTSTFSNQTVPKSAINEFYSAGVDSPILRASNPVFSLFDVNFIKKERFYTKLKYSRSPAYDIVSGGSAALLAGFIGFLISEKFGIELVDSGDFYIVFMYAVFFSFFCRPLLKILSENNTVWDILSFNFLIEYLMWGFSLVSNYLNYALLTLFATLTDVRREYLIFYFVLLLLGIVF